MPQTPLKKSKIKEHLAMMGGHSRLYKVECSQQTGISCMRFLSGKPERFLFHNVRLRLVVRQKLLEIEISCRI